MVYNEFDDSVPEVFRVSGGTFELLFDTYHGVPIDPDEEFVFTVAATLEDGSTVNGSRSLIARTSVPDKRCVHLHGKHPRFFLVREIMFKPNTVSVCVWLRAGCGMSVVLSDLLACVSCAATGCDRAWWRQRYSCSH